MKAGSLLISLALLAVAPACATLAGGASSSAGKLVTATSALRPISGELAVPPAPTRSLPRAIRKSFDFLGMRYLQGEVLGPLYCEDLSTQDLFQYSMADLAVAAGWIPASGVSSLSGSIRDLYRSGDRLWMGTNGIGAMSLDLSTGFWTRHDAQETPVPGHQVSVAFADAGYVFVWVTAHSELPQLRAGLHAFSVAQGRWLQITGIPAADVLSLGHEDSRGGQLPVDDRAFAGRTHVPPKGRVMVSTPRGDYLLSTTYSNGSKTELRIRHELLDRAFRGR